MRKATLQTVLCLFLSLPAVAENWFCPPLGVDSLVDAADRWQKRDGGIGFVVSDEFLFLLAACPAQFYAFMKTRPEILNSWLDQVEQLSGFTGSPQEKQEREMLLSALVLEIKRRPAAKSNLNVRMQILSKLESMCVRAVDQPAPNPPCHRVTSNQPRSGG
jgi:hypothetical protein